ncbi:hypothetical protein JZ751_003748 [Albula glossodonta]|uniref:protein disulfide-isomerase n=1 Tax=Albula glossodonta TaxID=121402 RepID=A0A8T2P5D3_9TELE|nr:hypothetical protein JZ751_003748 [Albula glossodonta]
MAVVNPTLVCAAVILLSTVVTAFVEDLDDTFKDRSTDDVWLVDFYAPWCGYCKKLEPVWQEVAVELKSSGSPVRVGKMDATAYAGIASDFGVRGYPTIKLLKGDLNYNYKGPRTKDDIIEFANRVAGPAVRSLPSKQMFEHVMRRHDVLFVFIGGESALKEKYARVASELIVYTNFFSASEDVLPKAVGLPELPAVVVFKDGTFFTYDEYQDGSLSAWVNKERFLGYLQIDGYILYELGETVRTYVSSYTPVLCSVEQSCHYKLVPQRLRGTEAPSLHCYYNQILIAQSQAVRSEAEIHILPSGYGKLVAMAVVDEKNPTEESIRLKTLIQRVSTEYRDHFGRDFQFGHMDGNDYINGLIMGLKSSFGKPEFLSASFRKKNVPSGVTIEMQFRGSSNQLARPVAQWRSYHSGNLWHVKTGGVFAVAHYSLSQCFEEIQPISNPQPTEMASLHFISDVTFYFYENREVAVPSIIILNTSNEQYFLPTEPVETMDQLLHLINSVLDGTAQAQGGDGFFQRIKRVAYDAKTTVMSVFRSSPLLGCFLFGLPLGVISLMCYGICTAESDDGADDMEMLKRDGLTDEEEEEEGQGQAMELEGPGEKEKEQEEKSSTDKKVD